MARPGPSLLTSLQSALPRDARLLVAVSGGIDSCCLLHGCLELRRVLRLHLEVAHVDHGLRTESKLDADFVRGLAQSGEAPFHMRVLGPPERGNLEAWGRKERYRFFRELLESQHLDAVLTAHNADDAAETLLMRLVSNKELRGIARWDRRRSIRRPLLAVPRAEIARYAEANSVEFRFDQSNLDTTRLRNRVRHSLLPILRGEFDSRIVETLSERGRALEEDLAELDKFAAVRASQLDPQRLDERTWLLQAREVLRTTPVSLRWRVLSRALLPVLRYPLGRRHATKALEVVLGSVRGVQLPGGWVFSRSEGSISLKQLS